MRIALILPGYAVNEADWGIPAFRDYADALAARHAVHVFALRYPYRRAIYSLHNVTVHSFNGARRRGARNVALWADVIRAMVGEGRRGRWDRIHAFFADQTGVCASIAGRLLRVPVVISLAGSEVIALEDIHYGEQLWRHHRAMIDWAAQWADVITVGSRYMLDLARQALPRARKKLKWAPLGVDTTRFSPREAITREPVLLQVASKRTVKNPALLLRAFERVSQVCPEARLEVVGRDWSEQDRAIARISVDGEIPHDRLPDIYRRAAVYLQTSRHEAQGMAVLEAAACGVPIVGTPVGVLPELAPVAAQIARSDSELADATIQLLTHLQDAARVGDAARARVCREYSIEKCVARFEKIYDDCR